MKKLAIRSTLFAGLAALGIAATALATPGSGLTTTTLATGKLQSVDVKVKTGRWKMKLETNRTSDEQAPSAARARSVNSISPGLAASATRAALFTVVPYQSPSRGTAGPVSIPIRTGGYPSRATEA